MASEIGVGIGGKIGWMWGREGGKITSLELYAITVLVKHLSDMDTSLLREVPLVPANAQIFSLKKTSIYRPLRANSYKCNLFITDTPVMTVCIQMFVVTDQS